MSLPIFDVVVETHGPAVLRVCRALLGPNDAEDAWAETFLAALRAYPALPADANVEAWLVTIAHRKAIDHLRARARRAVPVAEPPQAAVRDGMPPDEHLDLVAALARLPDRQRFAVAYHHLGGLPYKDIAAIVGGSTDAVRRAAADGVAALRRLLADSPDRPDLAGAAGAPRTPGTSNGAHS